MIQMWNRACGVQGLCVRVNKTGRQQRFLEILAAQVTRQQRLKFSDVRIVESPTGLSQDVVMRRAPWCRPVHDRDYAARSDRSAHVGQHRWCLGPKNVTPRTENAASNWLLFQRIWKPRRCIRDTAAAAQPSALS